MADRVDPYRNFRFMVQIEGIIEGYFTECTIPDTTTDPVEYRDGKDEPTMSKLPGLTKYGNLTLKYGVTDDMSIFNWRKTVIEGKTERKDVTVILRDEDGSDKAEWVFSSAWPSKYDAPDLSAKGNDVAIETLEIVHEGMERKK